MQNTIKQYDYVINQCRELFSKKMKDYGSAWRILRLSSLTDQIFIKAQRIRGLQQNSTRKVDEGQYSEFIGIINYSIMAKGNALRSEQNSSDKTMAAEAKGIPGAVANTPPAPADLNTARSAGGGAGGELRSQSTSEVKNYEVSRTVSSTVNPTNIIRKINAAVLVRERSIVDPETGLPTTQKMTEGELLQIEKLVADAVGIDKERGDSLTVSSAPFMSELTDAVTLQWYEKPYMRAIINQAGFVLILAIVILGVVRPLLNRVLIPVLVPGMSGTADSEDDIDIDQIEVGEGESLEDIKAKLKPKKASISAEMLDTANTYDDKVAVIRMIVSDEAGRVSNVFKSMMSRDIG